MADSADAHQVRVHFVAHVLAILEAVLDIVLALEVDGVLSSVNIGVPTLEDLLVKLVKVAHMWLGLLNILQRVVKVQAIAFELATLREALEEWEAVQVLALALASPWAFLQATIVLVEVTSVLFLLVIPIHLGRELLLQAMAEAVIILTVAATTSLTTLASADSVLFII